jgi:hypothetical protein
MINYEKVAEKIFAVIKGHGHTLAMFKEDGMDTTDAAEARRFFVQKPNYMVTLDDESNTIKINKNSNLSLDDLESIMKQLKNLARANMLNTHVQVFGKEITPKDFAYQAKKYRNKEMGEITEASLSRMSGSTKTSYQTLESVKMIVRHRKAVDEEVRGSRSRQISAIFLEQAGERFRFPHNNLQGARAMARHMYEGGEMGDAVGTYIVESVGNLIQLNEFVRYARTNKLINENSEDIIATVQENIATLRGELKGLTGANSYAKISEAIAAREASVLEEDDTDDLKDMFTVRKFDEKFGDTLPLVNRLMNEKTAWRNALVEASTQTVWLDAKEALSEVDIVEFDSPVQQMGYKIQKVANRMVETGDLKNVVGRVAGKLIEGSTLSEFEKTIVRNVMENAKVQEEKVCENCDCEPCECEKNTFESILAGYDLKMKMLEHEDIFVEGDFPAQGHDQECAWWAGCHNDATTTEPHPILGDVPICDRCVGKLRKIEGLDEAEGDTCIRCRKGTMETGDTMTGAAEQCNRCGYQRQVSETSDILGYDPETQWMDPAGGVHDNDEEDPRAMYEDDSDNTITKLISRSFSTSTMGERLVKDLGMKQTFRRSGDNGVETVYSGEHQGVPFEVVTTMTRHMGDFTDLVLSRDNFPSKAAMERFYRDIKNKLTHQRYNEESISEEPGDWDHGYNYEGGGNVDPEDFMDDCQVCDGTGKHHGEDCENCDGEGYV